MVWTAPTKATRQEFVSLSRSSLPKVDCCIYAGREKIFHGPARRQGETTAFSISNVAQEETIFSADEELTFCFGELLFPIDCYIYI